jgi:Tol biopolymer transport system component
MGSPVFVSDDLTAKFGPALSRDGAKLIYGAFGGLGSNRFEIRIKDLAGGTERAIPIAASEFGQSPRISPDGTVIAYTDIREGSSRTFIMKTTESVGREVCDSCAISGFYADPRYVLISEQGKRLLRLDLSNGEKRLVLEAPEGGIAEPALSPDDRWVAFGLGKSGGRVSLAIAPLADGPADRKDWIVLFEEDRYLGSPAWSPGGNSLFYLSERDGACKVWCLALDPRTKGPVGDSRIVFDGGPFRLDLNMPRGDGTVSVGRDKLAVWAGGATGNIYMAVPKRRR